MSKLTKIAATMAGAAMATTAMTSSANAWGNSTTYNSINQFCQMVGRGDMVSAKTSLLGAKKILTNRWIECAPCGDANRAGTIHMDGDFKRVYVNGEGAATKIRTDGGDCQTEGRSKEAAKEKTQSGLGNGPGGGGTTTLNYTAIEQPKDSPFKMLMK